MDSINYVDLQGQLMDLYLRVCSGSIKQPDVVEKALKPLEEKAEGSEKLVALTLRYRKLISLASGSTPDRSFSKSQRDLARGRAKSESFAVITSINPFKRGAMQKLCFDKWAALGFEVYTVNHTTELDALTALGIDEKRIIEINDAQTGLAVHGKPMPRILSTLEICLRKFQRGILLVNSDLFPAADDSSFVSTWAAAAPVVALTRQDVQKLDYFAPSASAPYRQGLDAFMLSYDAIEAVLAAARLYKASDRMCFGIVGWDFFMGALIKTHCDGTFLDSGILLHERHQQTYSDVDEFSSYLTAMQALGYGIGKDHVLTAAEMYGVINETCDANADHALPSTQIDLPEERPMSAACAAALAAIEQEAPAIIGTFGRNKLLSLLLVVEERGDLNFSDLLDEIELDELLRAYGNVLLLLVAFIQLRPDAFTGMTEVYPKGNMHAPAVTIIRNNTTENWPLKRFEIAKLFSIEFATYGLFNPRLFNFLAMSCESDNERALVAMIREFVLGDHANVA
ncbi:MAG: hypothetical protein AAFQ19_10015 [Pseudomonadota bacterium]